MREIPLYGFSTAERYLFCLYKTGDCFSIRIDSKHAVKPCVFGKRETDLIVIMNEFIKGKR